MSAPLFKLNKILFTAIFLAVISNINAQLLELKPHKTTYNLQSIAGVPISTTFGEPLGSNGNSPTSDQLLDSLQACRCCCLDLRADINHMH